jgi:hypothetical protein
MLNGYIGFELMEFGNLGDDVLSQARWIHPATESRSRSNHCLTTINQLAERGSQEFKPQFLTIA